MKGIFQNSTTYFLGLLANVLTPTLQRRIVRFCFHLVSDVPELASTWVVQFGDPRESGKCRRLKIDATLHQFGRFIRGYGHVQGNPGDIFLYKGTIKRNSFYGTFRRVDSRILAGTGTFVLKISPSSRTLKGNCTWYDNTLDDVWATTYVWRRA